MSESPSSAISGPVLDAVEWLSAARAGGAALLRVRGRGAMPDGPPALTLHTAGTQHVIEPLPDARFGRDPDAWRGTYLLPDGIDADAVESACLTWRSGSATPVPRDAVSAAARAFADPAPARAAGRASPPSRDAPRGSHVVDPAVMAERRARRAEADAVRVAEEAAARLAQAEAAWAEHRARLESDLARAREEASTTAARLEAALAAAASGEARLRLESLARSVLEDELDRARAMRLALAEDLDAERAMREALAAALVGTRAHLVAARAASEADCTALAALGGELDAERTTLAVARGTAADLREALALARTRTREAEAAATAARHERDRARTDLAAARAALLAPNDRATAARAILSGASDRAAAAGAAQAPAEAGPAAPASSPQAAGALFERVAALAARSVGELDLRRVAGTRSSGADARLPGAEAAVGAPAGAFEPGRDGAEAAAGARASGPFEPGRGVSVAAAGSPAAEGEPGPLVSGGAAGTRAAAAEPARLVADLEAAARALRAAVPVTGSRHLRRTLVRLARTDAAAAGRLLAQLLPAQGAVLGGPLEYDLTIREVGTFAISLDDGVAAVRRVSRPRPRREAGFHLTGGALAFAELLAGEQRPIRRVRGPVRLRGRRRALRALDALRAAELSLGEAVRAGARLEPRDVHAALAHGIEPAWTRGHTFTIAHEVEAKTWWLAVRDGEGLALGYAEPEGGVSATVAMSRAAFDALLRAEPAPHGERPTIRGDREAVRHLKGWIDRATGGG